MLIFVQFGEILGEVVETFRDLSSQTPVGRRAKRKKVTHLFILFFKNDLLSLTRRLYENESDPSIYISTNRGQTLHIFYKIRKKWEFFHPNMSQICQRFSGLRARY